MFEQTVINMVQVLNQIQGMFYDTGKLKDGLTREELETLELEFETLKAELNTIYWRHN